VIAVVFLERISVAAQPQIHVMRERAIVIWTFNVLEVLSVEPTTAEEIILRLVVAGRVFPIAVQVYIIASLFMHSSKICPDMVFVITPELLFIFFRALFLKRIKQIM
jgi:hypothetical protein